MHTSVFLGLNCGLPWVWYTFMPCEQQTDLMSGYLLHHKFVLTTSCRCTQHKLLTSCKSVRFNLFHPVVQCARAPEKRNSPMALWVVKASMQPAITLWLLLSVNRLTKSLLVSRKLFVGYSHCRTNTFNANSRQSSRPAKLRLRDFEAKKSSESLATVYRRGEIAAALPPLPAGPAERPMPCKNFSIRAASLA